MWIVSQDRDVAINSNDIAYIYCQRNEYHMKDEHHVDLQVYAYLKNRKRFYLGTFYDEDDPEPIMSILMLVISQKPSEYCFEMPDGNSGRYMENYLDILKDEIQYDK